MLALVLALAQELGWVGLVSIDDWDMPHCFGHDPDYHKPDRIVLDNFGLNARYSDMLGIFFVDFVDFVLQDFLDL